ncbi:MAG: hypothetical protein ACI8XO_000697 [Verrucomicrobiales bacterium]|jgi:hypothetical protein
MNKEFEAIVMNTYAELCIMWRVAHVTNQSQAEDFDAKLKSLEAVVAAFDLTTPMEEVAAQAQNEVPASAAPSRSPAGSPNTQPAGSPATAGGGGMMLED